MHSLGSGDRVTDGLKNDLTLSLLLSSDKG